MCLWRLKGYHYHLPRRPHMPCRELATTTHQSSHIAAARHDCEPLLEKHPPTSSGLPRFHLFSRKPGTVPLSLVAGLHYHSRHFSDFNVGGGVYPTCSPPPTSYSTTPPQATQSDNATAIATSTGPRATRAFKHLSHVHTSPHCGTGMSATAPLLLILAQIL